jgi:hypothetical protein
MAEVRPLLLAALVFSALAGSAMARDLGDFGRVEKNVFNRLIAPIIEQVPGRAPVRDVLVTDEESAMHDLMFRFLIAPEARDHAAPLRPARTRAEGVARRTTYFAALKATAFLSPHARYRSMENQIEADIALLPRVFQAICAVEAVDRRRGIAVASAGLDTITAQRVEGRQAANRADVADFALLLAERLDAYQFALDHLLAETPYPEGRAVDARITLLGVFVGFAAAGQYCDNPTAKGPPAPAPRALMSLPPLK